MANSLYQALDFNQSCSALLCELVSGMPIESNAKNNLMCAYADIALEYHDSIRVLVNENHRGSALALGRPLIEAVFRGLWVIHYASSSDIEAIGQRDGKPLPRFREMAELLDKANQQAGGYFASISDQWNSLNGYTHSGLHQLGRRFRNGGHIGPNYSDAQVAALLKITSLSLLALFEPVLLHLNFPYKSEKLNNWVVSYFSYL